MRLSFNSAGEANKFLKTVAMVPVEAMPLSSGRNVVVAEVLEVATVAFHRAHAHFRYRTYQNQLAPHLHLPESFLLRPHLCFRLCNVFIGVYPPAKANLVPGRADSQRH
jgi:hypothetical protein